MTCTSVFYAASRTYSGVLLAALWIAAGACGAIAAPAGAQNLQDAVLEVSLRPNSAGETMIVLRGAGGLLYLEEQDFARLRLRLPPTQPILHNGRRFYAPAAIRGSAVVIDEARQRALITVPPQALETTRLSAAPRRSPPITPASPGAFLNYQLYSQQVAGRRSTGVYSELGLFAGVGALTSTAAGRADAATRSMVRLDTTLTRDFPAELETLNLGDAISDGASWGYAERYAGIRWSRNFSLRPDLLTIPLLTTGGTATVPSTVDVFVNNQLVTSRQLPAGPFVIDRLPVISGSGDVNVVVRDALGREQVLSRSFYSSASLLAPGLTQYSINIGSIRENYALSSGDYGAMLGEASYRKGLSDYFTLEGHGEYLAHGAHAAGLNASVRIGNIGLLNLTAANGGDRAGTGWLRGVGFEHRGPRLSFLAGNSWYGGEFAQVGQAIDPAARLRQRSLLQTGVRVARFGSLSLAYVRQTYRNAPEQQTLSLTHSITLGRSGTVNVTLTKLIGEQRSTSAYLIFVLPIGSRRAAMLTAVGGSGAGAPANEAIASLTQNPPVGPGDGYRLSASTAGNYDADWRRQFSAADLELETARNAGVDGHSAYLTGSMTMLGGRLDAARAVNGSFALVDVDGLANVPVFVENQLTTHTDSSGRALLYNLRPYEANRISIDPADLPLDTAIASSSTIIAPPYRSGVVVRFPVARVRGGTFRLVTDDGEPVPVGGMVRLKDTLFPVVLDGFVYVTGYEHRMDAVATWGGNRCVFQLPPPPKGDPLPDVGTIHCHAAPRLSASDT